MIDRAAKGNEPIPDYGDHMTMAEFLIRVEAGAFIDYDGFGHYATKTKMSDQVIKPSDVGTPRFRRGYSHVVWFNR